MKNRHEPDSQMNRLTEAVIGAAIEVHRELGPGFLESVYEKALCLELTERTITYQSQAPVSVMYKGIPIGQGYKATGLWVGLLINFNIPVLKDGVKRIVLTN